MLNLTDIEYDWVSEADLQNAIRIEREGFPSDEAASIDAFRLRQSQAGNLFLGAYARSVPPEANDRHLVGYVCATLSPDKRLAHNSMSRHVPGATSVCVHSICVDTAYRRGGLGLALMKEYITKLEKACAEGAPYENILLITHEGLRDFYEKAGFEWLGKSEVKHGSKEWFEMRRELHKYSEPEIALRNAAPELPPAQQQQASNGQQQQLADILQALQQQRGLGRGNKPPSRLLAGFSDGIADVITSDSRHPGVFANKYDLTCPREECGSLILKKRVATWVERSSVQLEPSDGPVHVLLPVLPEPPETTHWWLITPSPMAFENIGFSRPVAAVSASEPQMKFLACAECDLGPLGWSTVGGTEFWLACSRVAYLD